MSDDADIDQLLEKFQSALDTLNNIADIETLIKKLDDSNNRKLLKRVKSVVSDVYIKVNNVKERVSKAYKRVKIRSTSENEVEKEGSDNGEVTEASLSLDESVSDAARYSSVIGGNKGSKKLTDEGRNTAHESNRGDSDGDNETVNHENNSPETPSDLANTEENCEPKERESSQNEDEIIEPTPEKQKSLKIILTLPRDKSKYDLSNSTMDDKTADTVSDKEYRNNETINKEDIPVKPAIPKIKLVDISKLLEPNKRPLEMISTANKNRKSVTFDSSVIVLTSSDEETPKKKPKDKDPSCLKSALRKSPQKVIDLSDDSDSKENNDHVKKRRKDQQKKQLISDNSSEDSDFDTGGRRLRKQEKDKSSKFSGLIKERSNKRFKANRRRRNDSDSDQETNKLNGKTMRATRKSESNSKQEEKISNLGADSKKLRKKELLEESSLSEGSSPDSDDSDSQVLAKIRSTCRKSPAQSYPEASPNDPKFKSEVFVPLPKFCCEELPKLYRRKKELFDVKKLSRMPVLRPTRKKSDCSDNSDASEKPEPKKIKLTLKLNKKNDEKEESSGKEESGTENISENNEEHMDTCGMMDSGQVDAPDNGTATEQLAMECLNEIVNPSDVEEQNNETGKDKDTENSEKGKDTDDCDTGNSKRKKNCVTEDEDESVKQVIENNTEEPKLNGKLSDTDEESNTKKSKKKEKKAKKRSIQGSDSDEAKNNREKDCSDKEDSSDNEGNKDTISLGSSDDENSNKSGSKQKAVELESSDSEANFAKFSKKKDKRKGELVKEIIKKKTRLLSDSDSDDNEKNSDDSKDKSSESERNESEAEDKEKEDEPAPKKPARKRIKHVDSSSDDESKSTRKHIRKMIDRDSLSETTKKAEQEEKDRKARIAEKQKKYNKIFELKADSTVDKVVLDFDEKTDKPLLSVHKKLVKQLKPHQVHGVKFMWDACFESLSRAKKNEGSGCILAHCMGLGKTLQVIALIHTLLTNQDKSKVEKVMVVCPVNTVLNWKNEFKKWMPSQDDFEVYELVSCKASAINQERKYIVDCWHNDGGVLIIGYNMFRTLSNPDNKSISKKIRQAFQTGLVDPGPDLVVCDEGHLLKNEKTNLSIAMNRVKTQRRIVLTGTPLQNNLREYWCMVQFIKPNLLGTYKEYLNRFVNPIINGQYTDSTQHDIMVMRRRSHVLHKLLDGVVQRQDYAVLEPYLPPKYEYVLFLKLTEVQAKLYKHYVEHFARRNDGSNRTSFLFTDFQELQRISTHPRVLLDKSNEDKEKKEKEDDTDESDGSIKDFIDDDSEGTATSNEGSSSSSDGSESSGCSAGSHNKKKKKKIKNNASSSRRTRLTRAQAAQKRDNGELSESEGEPEVRPTEWWDEYISRDELDNINHSAKLFLLFQILKECEEIGDKILVFSQSLYTLNCIEYFLGRIDEATQRGEIDKMGGHVGSWALGLDYFRLDGSSSCDNRASWCDEFNDPENTRARLFLISTKAGGLGINLVAANRVIIFDVSWNPSHDIQSIYRVYRFGQTKPSYIYRFVTYGSMEMKIYERQVTKQAISKRVIDEQQIDRHYSQNDIQELYKTDLAPTDRPIPMVPKDVLLGEMLQKYEDTIYKYHEHQSLLENKQDEELNEEERKAAWEEFENEKVLRKTTVTNFGSVHLGAIHNNALAFSPQLIQMALGNIVRKDNPTWSDVQIKGILPALVTQLQVQMSENEFSMYNRVQQEIRLMQALHAQRMRENFFKQYQMQQVANQMLGNLNVTPEDISRLQMQNAQIAAGRSNDVIELND